MRELQIGDRVRSRHGACGVVHAVSGHLVTVDCQSEGVRITEAADRWTLIAPPPADIPRERVADLHAAVAKRVTQLANEMSHEGHESDDVHGYPHPRICLTCTRDEDHEVPFYVREGADAEAARSAHAELSEVAESLRLLLEVGS